MNISSLVHRLRGLDLLSSPDQETRYRQKYLSDDIARMRTIIGIIASRNLAQTKRAQFSSFEAERETNEHACRIYTRHLL